MVGVFYLDQQLCYVTMYSTMVTAENLVRCMGLILDLTFLCFKY